MKKTKYNGKDKNNKKRGGKAFKKTTTLVIPRAGSAFCRRQK